MSKSALDSQIYTVKRRGQPRAMVAAGYWGGSELIECQELERTCSGSEAVMLVCVGGRGSLWTSVLKGKGRLVLKWKLKLYGAQIKSGNNHNKLTT